MLAFKLRKRFRAFFVFFLLLFLLLTFVSGSFSFEPYAGFFTVNELRTHIRAGSRDGLASQRCQGSGGLRTHPWLAEQAIKIFERPTAQGGYGIPLNNDIKANILMGTIEEDIDLVGGATESVPELLPGTYTNVSLDDCISDTFLHIISSLQVQSNRVVNHFYDGIGPLPVAPGAVSSADWATRYTVNLQRWSEAVRKVRDGSNDTEKLLGWRILGHILHLLQDLGVPAHVRDDPHLPGNPEPYETLLGSTPYNEQSSRFGLIDVSNIAPANLPTQDIERVFLNLLVHIQANHFSEDTIFQNNKFGRTLFRNTDVHSFLYQFNGGYYIQEGSSGRFLAKYRPEFFLNNAAVPCVLSQQIGIYRIPGSIEQLACLGQNGYLTVNDSEIVTGYWKDAAPRIISLSAQVIKIFNDLVTPPASVYNFYDSFQGLEIDTSRWDTREFVRELRGGKLFSKLRGDRDTDVDANTLFIANPTTVRSLQADVSLLEFTPRAGGVSARIVLSIYNTGTRTVIAEIHLGGLGPTPVAFYRIRRCDDATCSSSTVLRSISLGQVSTGSVHRLLVQWNGSVVTFGFNNLTTTVNPVPIAGAITGPFTIATTGLATRSTVDGTVSAIFDNVVVNGVSYDTFSSITIDPSKWVNQEIVREIVNQKLVSNLRKIGGSDSTNTFLFGNSASINAVKMDVALNEFFTSGATTRARIQGRWYKSNLGDIHATIDIGGSGTTPSISYNVGYCVDVDCDTFVTIQNHVFGSANIGQTYTLAIEWTGSQFIFSVNGANEIFNPIPQAPVVSQHPDEPGKRLQTRKFRRVNGVLTDGGSGSIKATFDNVFIKFAS